MGDLLAIGTRGLLSYQSALTVTAQNITNVNTPYYARRIVNFTEAAFNNGVDITSVTRVFQQSLSNGLLAANIAYNGSDIAYQQLLQTESTLDSSSNSIDTYLRGALAAINTANTNPSNMGSRTGYLNALTTLSNRFSAISSQLKTQQDTINSGIKGDIGQANQILAQIGTINGLVTQGQGQDINALLDQREQLTQDLTKYINFTSQVDDNNSLNITIGNGVSLVYGSSVSQIITLVDPNNPSNVAIAMQPLPGNNPVPITNFFTGGSVGGYISARDGALTEGQRALNRLGLAFQAQMNAQNKLGIDYNGNLGGNIFPDVNAAQAMADRSIPSLNNTGTGGISVHIDDASAISTSDYKLAFTSSSDYVLTRTVNGQDVPVTSGNISTYPATVSADGFTLNLTAGFAAGDQFSIAPARNAASSMRLQMTNPELLALGMPVNALSNNNKPNNITLDQITDTTTSAFSIPKQLNPPITVNFLTSTSYELVNANDNTVMEGPISYDPTTGGAIFPTPGGYDPGYRVSLHNTMAAGDTFSISYNVNNASDNRNGLIMANMYTKQLVAGDTLTYSGAFNLLTSDVSTSTNNASTTFNGNKTVQQAAEVQYNAVSGVSLAEEVANTQRYLQSYQASAQVLQVARQVFDIIVNLGR